MQRYREYFIDGEAKSVDGKHRLLKLLEAVGTEGDAFDFHELLWQRWDGGAWVEVLNIPRQLFQGDHPLRRWVSRVHSIDPESGRAIISVGKGDVPEGNKCIHYHYTWREWDLRGNKEIAVLKLCKDPFDPLESEEDGS
jgi:hypothetical protein